jgi:aspartate/methionine/tyrosine aminotransferase
MALCAPQGGGVIVVSRRVERIGLSPTLRISALAQSLRASGVDVLDFSAGQPDFPTPEPVKQAGIRAIEENKTRYTPNAGAPELRQAISRQLGRTRGVEYPPDQILVSSGAKASLFFAFMALVDPGDDVLLPTPYWVSYPEQIQLAEGRAVPVPSSDETGFKLTPEALEAAVTKRSRAIVLNYPSNPSGACYSRDELEALARVCLRHDLWIIADEIYSGMVYDGREFTSVASLGEEFRAKAVIIDGMSKSYAMTGWRMGHAAGPKDVISAMARMQSHSTSNASSIAQWASIEALDNGDEEVLHRLGEFAKRRDEVVRLLSEVEGVTCLTPEGAFYAFPNVSGLFGRTTDKGPIHSGQDLAEYLLEQANVAVVPGDPFGAPQHIRVSYAVSLDRIREGVRRISDAIAKLGH